MSHCLVCNAEVEPFLTFGPMPIANGFLDRADFAKEPRFNLAVGHRSYNPDDVGETVRCLGGRRGGALNL